MKKNASELALIKSLPVDILFFFGDIKIEISRHFFSKKMSTARSAGAVKRKRVGRYAGFMISQQSKDAYIAKLMNEKLIPGFKDQLLQQFLRA